MRQVLCLVERWDDHAHAGGPRSQIGGSTPTEAPPTLVEGSVLESVGRDDIGLMGDLGVRDLGVRYNRRANVGAHLLALIAVGLMAIWRRRVRNPLILTLAALAALWPVGLALRLTQASTEISGRAPEFVFFGAGFLAAYLAARPPSRPRRLR